jgi:hypothetical protein
MTTLGIVVLVGLIFLALVALVGDIVYDLCRHRLRGRRVVGCFESD